MKRLLVPILYLLIAHHAWANDFYTHGNFPAPNSPATSSSMRAELDLISSGFDKLPGIVGNNGKAVIVNGGGTALSTTTGTLSLDGNFAVTGAFATTFVAQSAATLTLPAISGTLATIGNSESLTNKTIDLGSNTLTGTTAQFNTALTDNDFATLTGVETLTNKTLTSPTISSILNGGTLTLPSSTDTLVGRATTDTLTNKTLTSPTITTPTINTASINSSVLTTSTVAADPTAALGISSKQYVDAKILVAPLRSYLAGYTMSTAGASTTMTIAAGQATDSTTVASIVLASSIAKTTSSWAVGTGNGCLDSGSITTSTWYHFYAILRPDTGVVDVLCSTSASSPTLPANYTLFRRIGSGRTNGSSQWLAFTQDGDYFRWAASVLDVNVTNPGTSAVSRTLTVPSGVNVQAIFNYGSYDPTNSNNIGTYFSDLAATDEAPSSSVAPLISSMAFGATNSGGFGMLTIRTNSSAQVRSRVITSSATSVLYVATLGWIDRRGRDS